MVWIQNFGLNIERYGEEKIVFCWILKILMEFRLKKLLKKEEPFPNQAGE